jgi:hypothetical protein
MAKRISMIALVLGLFVVASQGFGQQQELKKMIRKQQMEAEKKVQEAKKREDEKRKMENMKADLAKKENGTRPEKFSPHSLGDLSKVVATIDREIDEKIAKEKVISNDKSGDAEFLRRVYLDLTGVIPSPSKAREFLDSQATDKRAKLIEELLASPNFGKHQADVWMSVLVSRTSDQRRISYEPLRDWLADQFNANRSWSQITSDLITSEGTQEKNPATTFYLSNNTVDKMTDTVSKVFLGVSIQCAQCHDHKFEDWKQTEYWSLSQFFMKVQVNGTGPGARFEDAGVEEVKNPNRKKTPLPEDAKEVPARFLRDASAVNLPTSGSVRPTLAKWVISPTNPYFSKAFVNRVWSDMFGTGIVDPVDDMGPNAQPSHPKLLNDLAAHLAADQFNVKNLFRAICLSNAYQRSSKDNDDQTDDNPQFFSRMATKVLTPEQLFDSTASILNIDAETMLEKMKKANPQLAKLPLANPRNRFVDFFLAGQEMANTKEYDVGIPQALKLMNGRIFGNPQSVKRIMGNRKGTAAIEELYLATLSRKPTKEEIDRCEKFINDSKSKDTSYVDILWALINCSEFTMVR